MALRQMYRRRGFRLATLVAILALVFTNLGIQQTAASTPRAGAPVFMAELFPMTGNVSFVGSALLHGATVGEWEVNHHGGIMGQQLQAELQDDAGDAVDAVPAWHALELKKPAFELGPTVLTAASVIRLYDPTHLVDFLVAGAPTYDNMSYKYVYRVTPSDSTMAKGMAAYAIHKKLLHAVMLFTNGFNSQTIVPPLSADYQRHGGHVVANVSLVPGQSSYRTELEQAFAKKPDVAFWQSDAQTAGTLFHNMEELGLMKIPVIGTDNAGDVTIAKAMGLSYASKYLSGMAGSAPAGPAWKHYTVDYQQVYHTRQPLDLSSNMYDAVVIAALAMDAAHSTNPSVWVNKLRAVSDPPGQRCATYTGCYALLRHGKKINFDGASGPMDFNNHHNVFGSWDVVQFDTSGKLHTLYHEPASLIQRF
ncbi:MAG TPA: ABC transporter substrate-binding protein [Chloroflexota bacterium]|nr:ABC transporter substrate-binding protein [Chloroflexota bacterium]